MLSSNTTILSSRLPTLKYCFCFPVVSKPVYLAFAVRTSDPTSANTRNRLRSGEGLQPVWPQD